MKKIISLLVLVVLLVGCGSTKSLKRENLIKYAVISVNDTITVSGVLLDETEVDISLIVDGTKVTYEKSKIVKRKIGEMPRADLMQADIVKNTATTSKILSFFVTAGIAIALIAPFVYKWNLTLNKISELLLKSPSQKDGLFLYINIYIISFA